MGGKVSSTKTTESDQQGLGAVIFKNNYAVQNESYQPVYVMGYLNAFAVQQYEVSCIYSDVKKSFYKRNQNRIEYRSDRIFHIHLLLVDILYRIRYISRLQSNFKQHIFQPYFYNKSLSNCVNCKINYI